jgi:hypothetical protein
MACGNTNNNNNKEVGKELQTDVFPVIPFIQQQIQQVDSLQLPTMKYVTNKEKTDSSIISMSQFRMLANEFMQPDISEFALKNYYKENSFADQSIPSVTLTYSTEKKDLPVQRMDIIIKPNPVMEDKVQTVYIEKRAQANDTLIIKKLYWKANANFQIITSKQVPYKPESVTKLKVVWDYTD